MKIGMSIGFAGAKMDIPIKRIQRAEELGFDAVWAAETYSSDSITPLAWIGAQTKRIRLGTGIAALAARSPANLAMCAQTIDAMCGEGRMIVGLGVSGPQIVEGWHGQPWGKPADRLRDYVAIMRKVWRREPLDYQGKEISVPYTGPGSSGLGKPLKNIMHANPNIPIMLATSTPGNIRMTGEIADGWQSMHLAPDSYKTKFRKFIEEGIARRTDGMTIDKFDVRATLGVQMVPDVRAALDAMKPGVALYAGGMGAKSKNYHTQAMIERGFGEAALRIQDLYLSGRKDEAAAAVPDEYLDDENLIGPPDRIRERFKLWLDSGMSSVSISNPTDEVIEVLGEFTR